MNKVHKNINWEDYPSVNTPVNARNLLIEDRAIDAIDDRVIVLNSTKFDKSEAQGLFKDVSLNRTNGVITFTMYNGATKTIDTLLEKIAVNFDYDSTTQRLIITLDDGEKKFIDLSALITQYEFLDSETLDFQVLSDGKVTAIVKNGSIQEKHLQPNYLADIKVEVAKAQSSAASAAESEISAAGSASAAGEKAAEASESANSSAASAETATQKATAAETSATNAANSATTAMTKANEASASASNANSSATSASDSAATATNKANAASTSAANAANSATSADTYAKKSQSYAVGGTGTRPGEDNDCAKKYYEQAKSISESLSGALRPMGTVAFANLPALSSASEGDMYNVSNQFTTTADFTEGSGTVIPAGSNVYKTADGKWDVLAGSPVTGVKGSSETSYRNGNVNLSPEDIGAVSKSGDDMTGDLAMSDADVIFTTMQASGGHARGMDFKNRDGTLFGSIGAMGTGGTFSRIYLSAGTDAPWAENNGLIIYSGSIKWKGANVVTEAAGVAKEAIKANTLKIGNDSAVFHWTGKEGQPPWVWGGEGAGNQYVYNPANFHVNTADNIAITHGNEICFDYNGDQDSIYFNYKLDNRNTASTAVKNYYFANGQENVSGVTLYADNFAGTAAKAVQDGIGNNIASTYLPLSGGTMTGSIITPANDNMGIIPATNNYGQIGSSEKKFYRMYASTFNGNLSGTATKATSDGSGNNIVNTYATKNELKNRDNSYDAYELYGSVAGGPVYMPGEYSGTIDYTKYSTIMLCFTNPYRSNVYCSTSVPTAAINTGSMYPTTLWCHSNAVPSKSGSATDAFSSTVTMSAKFEPYSKKWSLYIQPSCVGYVRLELICIKK